MRHWVPTTSLFFFRAVNGGFGMVLDGSERVDAILRMSMPWDTMVGVSGGPARRGGQKADIFDE